MAPFLIFSAPTKAHAEVLRYARAMKEDLPVGGKLGVAGFCWGGYGSTNLCMDAVSEGSDVPLINAQFNAHPSFLKTPDMIVGAITKYKVPYSSAVAEKDFMLGAKSAEETEAAIRQKVGSSDEYKYEFRIHKGCNHGFGVRADLDNPAAEKGYQEAARQAVDWFNKYLN